jgi:hypothetical protein
MIRPLESFLKDLADRRMTLEEVRAFSDVLIPHSPDVERSRRTDQKRHLLVDVFANSTNLQDLPFTAYRAYQATVEWAEPRPPLPGFASLRRGRSPGRGDHRGWYGRAEVPGRGTPVPGMLRTPQDPRR